MRACLPTGRRAGRNALMAKVSMSGILSQKWNVICPPQNDGPNLSNKGWKSKKKFRGN